MAYATAGAIVAHRARAHLRAQGLSAPPAGCDLSNATLWPIVLVRDVFDPGGGGFMRALVPVDQLIAAQRPDVQHAWVRVRDVFLGERYRFARVYPHVANAELLINLNACSLPDKCRVRDFAYSLPLLRPQAIVFQARAVCMADTNLIALMRHEFGHLCDPTPYVENTGQEQLADDIAEAVTGQRIYYDEIALQTLEPGTYPRPLHLHG